MDYFSGQKVIAIADEIFSDGTPPIVKGTIYEVEYTRALVPPEKCRDCGGTVFSIKLKEIDGWTFCPCGFRPLEDFGTSIIRKMNGTVEVKKVKQLETVKLFTA